MIAVLETFGSAGTKAKGNGRTANASNLKAHTPNPKPDPLDMALCLQGVRNGNEDSARELMDHLYPLVLKIVRAYLPRRMSEEDLVQTIFMKVFTRLPQFLGQVPIEHWVSRIAVNTCFNALKAEKIRPECRWSDLSEEEQYVMETLSVQEDPSPSYCGSTASDLLNRLLSSLPLADRMVIQLLHLEQKSVAHISQVTGWSVEAVKVRAFRARKKLQACLKNLEKDQPLINSSERRAKPSGGTSSASPFTPVRPRLLPRAA